VFSVSSFGLLVLWVALHVGELVGVFSSWVFVSFGDVILLVWLSKFRVCREMDKRFTVESKSFAFSALDGASMLRVEEKRKDCLAVVVLSP